MDRVHDLTRARGWHLLVEADGSRQLPLKAPGEREPVIPSWVDMVVVIAGLSGLGKPCNDAYIHRSEVFANITGLAKDEPVGEESLCKMLLHPQGGGKNLPTHAKKVVLLNQADNEDLIASASRMGSTLLQDFDAVLIGRLKNKVDDEILLAHIK
jgi:probable selenium-dependent hydroxylase accessory protein YqeC